MFRYISAHLPISFFYTLFLVSIGFLSGRFSFSASSLLSASWLFLGVYTGVLMLFLDRIVYTFSYPQEQLSLQFTHLWKGGRWRDALSLLYARREEQEKLTFRSVLFMAIWVPLVFFTLTSTVSLFGKGLVMGIMLHILYDAWRLQRMDAQRLNNRLFWQVKSRIGVQEQVTFLWIMTGVFLLFSIWVG